MAVTTLQIPDPIALRREHFRWMLTARLVEERLSALYRRGLIPASAFLGRGHEAISAAMGLGLRQGDAFGPAIRDMAGRLAFGETIDNALKVAMGKRSGNMRGRDGNIHRGEIRLGMFPMISHLGSMMSTISGVMLAKKLLGRAGTPDLAVGMVAAGEGTTSTGAFHEGLNFAAVQRLPVVVVVTNNGFAYSTPNHQQFSCENLVDRAKGYGVDGYTCDGCDPDETLRVILGATQAARDGKGVQLVVASTLRMCGHGEHDDAVYISQDLKDAHVDCLQVAKERLMAEGLLDAHDLTTLERRIQEEIDAGVAAAQADPDPDPEREDWFALSERWLTEGLRP